MYYIPSAKLISNMLATWAIIPFNPIHTVCVHMKEYGWVPYGSGHMVLDYSFYAVQIPEAVHLSLLNTNVVTFRVLRDWRWTRSTFAF